MPDPARLNLDPHRDADLSERRDEQFLVDRVRAGDPLAFEIIFRRYHAEVKAVAARVLGSRDGAEDVVQDVFLAVWSARERWHITTSLRAYLRRAARNLALRHASRAALRDHSPLKPGLTAGPSLEQQLDAASMEQEAVRAAGSLPPRAREIYRLSRTDGLSTREIAQRLHISPKTVELHLTRALAGIRAALARWRGG